MITRLEGQTVWVTQEPTLQEVTSGNYTLPVNFKVVDATNNTYKTVSYVFDSVSGARRLETGGGSSINFIEVTKNELDVHIANSTLISGVLYKITGVDENLYGGTTIYLTAINENTISENGIGEFYNPKYDQSVAGFNVWSSTLTYAAGDKAHWGGKTWVNVNGNVGSSIDIFTLDSEWSVIPYNENDYNVAYDGIKYDYANDTIIYRNEKNSNIVTTNYNDIQMWLYNPIRIFMWGNIFTYEQYAGIGNQKITNSYNENINFRGGYQINLTFENGSFQQNLTFENNSRQENLTFKDNSYQENLTFENGSSQINLILKSRSFQKDLIFDLSNQDNLTFDGSVQANLTFKNFSYQKNLIFNNSTQQNLIFDKSFQQDLTFKNHSYQNDLNFKESSYQINLTFENGSFQRNLIFNKSYQKNLNFENNSYQIDLTLNIYTYQENLTFENKSFQSNLILNRNLYQNNLIFNNFRYNRTSNQPTLNEENLTFIGNVPEATAPSKMIVYENNQIKQFPIPSGDGNASGDYIPLTGTEEGKPVTGDIKTSLDFRIGNGDTVNGIGSSNTLGIYENSIGITTDSRDVNTTGYDYMTSAIDTSLNIGDTFIAGLNVQTYQEINGVITQGVGFFSDDDYSEVLPENKLIYTQRAYVDKSNSYSLDEIKTGGTWINGKPIYRKVLTVNINDENSHQIILEVTGANIERCIGVKSIVSFLVDGETHSVQYTADINEWYKNADGEEWVVISNSPSKFLPKGLFEIIIEYTKTTDTL